MMPTDETAISDRLSAIAARLMGAAFGLAIAGTLGFDAVGVALGAMAALCFVLAPIAERRAERRQALAIRR